MLREVFFFFLNLTGDVNVHLKFLLAYLWLILNIPIFKLDLIIFKKDFPLKFDLPYSWPTLAFIGKSALLPFAPKANRLGMGAGMGWGHFRPSAQVLVCSRS